MLNKFVRTIAVAAALLFAALVATAPQAFARPAPGSEPQVIATINVDSDDPCDPDEDVLDNDDEDENLKECEKGYNWK